ncbi:GSCFA domain-containing protein [Flavobacterium agrisoli]|uniref:GSCFA domain-containing protein n=1 Tax=Flavobacterium agrisoli TaxID=2793066 RepID=A0A934PPW8_9FLAO|nr:GSCFA domain-containing protein [Flavobacterium agrisoli]MBK0370438.1 GSCFA domain-containing protein [Flavobacterium agrisoli]
MQFTTPIPILPSSNPIDYNAKIISLGSCFAENMGEKLDYFKFQNTTNPFGIIFNPVSIEKLIFRAIHQIAFTENDLIFHNQMWHCFEVHSQLSDLDDVVLLKKLNNILVDFRTKLEQTSHVIITYGTAWVYRHKESNEIVANCHKVPQKQFVKELLSVEIIQKSIQNTIKLIQSVNPKANFIFTISPVRHIKDGFVENQISKAHLITALHGFLVHNSQLTTQDTSRFTLHYFPSYEIMMDELRDYRYYAEDMLHPNQTAIRYIWSKFKENYLSASVFGVLEEVDTIQKSLLHRPFNPKSESHLKFEAKLREKITTLVQQYPHIQF